MFHLAILELFLVIHNFLESPQYIFVVGFCQIVPLWVIVCQMRQDNVALRLKAIDLQKPES